MLLQFLLLPTDCSALEINIEIVPVINRKIIGQEQNLIFLNRNRQPYNYFMKQMFIKENPGVRLKSLIFALYYNLEHYLLSLIYSSSVFQNVTHFP